MAVSTTILAVRNNLNTPAKPVPVLLSAYMEIYRYLEGNHGIRTRGNGDLMDRMNTERFPIQQSDLTLANARMLTIYMCQGIRTDCRHVLRRRRRRSRSQTSRMNLYKNRMRNRLQNRMTASPMKTKEMQRMQKRKRIDESSAQFLQALPNQE